MFNWSCCAAPDDCLFDPAEEGVLGWVEVCHLVEGSDGHGETGDCGSGSLTAPGGGLQEAGN